MRSAEELYQIAYRVHYKSANLQVAHALYTKLIDSYPDSKEANYSRSQLNNIEKDTKFSTVTMQDKNQAEDILHATPAELNSLIDSVRVDSPIAWKYKPLMMTTGFEFSGYSIDDYLGIAASESVAGMGMFRAVKADIANFVGSESESLVEKIEATREDAIRKLNEKATSMNANAVIGVSFNYTMFGGTIIGITASGTAVRVSKLPRQV